MVERLLPKQKVAGSRPVSRSSTTHEKGCGSPRSWWKIIMNGVDILTMQLLGSCNLVATQAEEVAPY